MAGGGSRKTHRGLQAKQEGRLGQNKPPRQGECALPLPSCKGNQGSPSGPPPPLQGEPGFPLRTPSPIAGGTRVPPPDPFPAGDAWATIRTTHPARLSRAYPPRVPKRAPSARSGAFVGGGAGVPSPDPSARRRVATTGTTASAGGAGST